MGSVSNIREFCPGFNRLLRGCYRYNNPLFLVNVSDMWADDLHPTVACISDTSQSTSHQNSPNERDLTTTSSCRGVNTYASWRWESDLN
jgi:hypothetical protein